MPFSRFHLSREAIVGLGYREGFYIDIDYVSLIRGMRKIIPRSLCGRRPETRYAIRISLGRYGGGARPSWRFESAR